MNPVCSSSMILKGNLLARNCLLIACACASSFGEYLDFFYELNSNKFLVVVVFIIYKGDR